MSRRHPDRPTKVSSYDPNERWLRLRDRFVSLGGDPGFLLWLRTGLSLPKREVDSRELRTCAKLSRSLRDSISRSHFLSSAPEAWSLRLQLFSLEEYLRIATARAEQRRATIVQRLGLQPRRGGHKVAQPELFSWLGALVPYTACLNKGIPKWAWIDDWLEYCEVPMKSGSQKIWLKTIHPRSQDGRLEPEIALLLRNATEQFSLYCSMMVAGMNSKDRERCDSLASDYSRYLTESLPILMPNPSNP